eukprot:6567-Heterococcus_DN1.PRE.6
MSAMKHRCSLCKHCLPLHQANLRNTGRIPVCHGAELQQLVLNSNDFIAWAFAPRFFRLRWRIHAKIVHVTTLLQMGRLASCRHQTERINAAQTAQCC